MKPNIPNGTIYRNRTQMYLAPVLHTTEQRFLNLLGGLTIKGFFLYDWEYAAIRGIEDLPNHLFLVLDPRGRMSKGEYVDMKGAGKLLQQTLVTIRKDYGSYYLTDYPTDLVASHHILALKLSPRYRKAYKAFVKGDFSKMFALSELETLLIKQTTSTGGINFVYGVLARTKESRLEFERRLQVEFNSFGTNLIEEADSQEYDHHAINPYYEILNAPFKGVKNHQNLDNNDQHQSSQAAEAGQA